MRQGHSITFCSPQEDLWRGYNKGIWTLFLFVPVVPLHELLTMRGALPEHKVRQAIKCIARCYISCCERRSNCDLLCVLCSISMRTLCASGSLGQGAPPEHASE